MYVSVLEGSEWLQQKRSSTLATLHFLTVRSPFLKPFFLSSPSGISPPERTNHPRLLEHGAHATQEPP